MNKTLIILIITLSSSASVAQSWTTSPYAHSNSPYAAENSPYSHQNSPYAWANNPLNSSSTNGIYDQNGDRTGYGVQRSDGGMNFFDNSGNRTGYQPGRRTSNYE